ncbi:calcium homeostasis modulator protein 6-like [Sorex araneus]|uniref:calcium homeostasis modulator protein 6-like n=1 Tax=Sorex araneus TaxID=42254 RepID=UPI0003314C2B|nr:calcium homeostasis modulator protein 6-like [Sorex araneus]
MEKFRLGVNLYLKYRSALGCGLATLLTISGESIFSNVVFQCPCSNNTWNLAYGLVFLLVPTLVLFILGYLVRTRTWRLLTNCCKQGCCPESCNACLQSSKCFWQLSCSVASLPLTWMAMALLEGTYYVCAGSGWSVIVRPLCSAISENDTKKYEDCTKQMPRIPCKESNLLPEMQTFPKVLKAQSQVLGWSLIGFVIICLMIGAIASQCGSPIGFQQLNFWKIYMKQEEENFKKEAKEHAAELAKKNVKCFFMPPSDAKNTGIPYTPSLKNWKEISSLYTFSDLPGENYYSLLHKCAETKSKNNSEVEESEKSSKDNKKIESNSGDNESGDNKTKCKKQT